MGWSCREGQGDKRYRLIKLNGHAMRLTKELIAEIVLDPQVEGEVSMILNVCHSLPVALTMLKNRKGMFSFKEIVKVALTYSMGEAEGLV